MCKPWTTIIGILFIGIGCLWVGAPTAPAADDKGCPDYGPYHRNWLELMGRLEQRAYISASVVTSGVLSPIGRWTLMRKGKDACAVRFTAFHRAHPNDRCVRDFEESFFADYDCVCQSDGSGRFDTSNAQSGHGAASQKPNIWRFYRGVTFVKCGPLEARWWYPTGISVLADDFDPDTSNHSNGIEIAPSGWTEISDIDANDTRLVWHRYDPVRDVGQLHAKAVIIPIADLPGGSDKQSMPLKPQ